MIIKRFRKVLRMTYHIVAEEISLNDLQKRIVSTDLVPSRACLRDNIAEKMKILEKQGTTTLASLRNALKNANRLAALAEATGIEPHYLILLRREIEGYFPKPIALKTFDWLSEEEKMTLEQAGANNTVALYKMTNSTEKRSELASSTGMETEKIEALAQLADLTRVQWVSPTASRMLIEAGYHSPADLAAADADELYDALAQVNADGKYYKGTIGLRDIKRLIHTASYVT